MPKTVILRIKRQEAPKGAVWWDEFELPHEERLNVIRCLQMIQRNPVTRQGKAVPAPVWDQSCLEEVCGACTMIVNGKVRQACTALVDELTQPITLEPLTKFPLVKDLVVDRQRFFTDLKNAKAWVDVDGTHALGAGPKYSEAVQEIRYELSRCMTCGCCLEVCPQYGEKKAFIGAAVISQVRVFNLHPTGMMQADKRLEVLTKPGGIADCGNAQNCVRACPKLIPLTESISAVGGQMVGYGLRKFLRKN
jgi:succinate dehydrogenase / fumarate reductase, iron-sulfur subunit